MQNFMKIHHVPDGGARQANLINIKYLNRALNNRNERDEASIIKTRYLIS